MAGVLLTLDSRGRVSIGGPIRKNGIEPAADWRLDFGPNQTLTLTPVIVTATPIESETA